jgi:hypothetical protein
VRSRRLISGRISQPIELDDKTRGASRHGKRPDDEGRGGQGLNGIEDCTISTPT